MRTVRESRLRWCRALTRRLLLPSVEEMAIVSALGGARLSLRLLCRWLIRKVEERTDLNAMIRAELCLRLVC